MNETISIFNEEFHKKSRVVTDKLIETLNLPTLLNSPDINGGSIVDVTEKILEAFDDVADFVEEFWKNQVSKKESTNSNTVVATVVEHDTDSDVSFPLIFKGSYLIFDLYF